MSNKREWEKYEGVAARRLGGSRVTIRQDGGVYMDAETWRQLGEPAAVYFLWHEKARTIGVQAGHADEPSAVIVRDAKQGLRAARSMAFMRKCGVDVTQSWRLPFAYVEHGVLILELKTMVPVGMRWKQKRVADEKRAVRRERLDEAEKIRQDRLKAAEVLAAERAELKQEREKARDSAREFERRTRELARMRRRHEARHGQ